MTHNQRVLATLREHQHDMVADLTRLVEMESPTDNKSALDRLGEHLAARLQHLGAQVEVFPQSQAGDHLRARWESGDAEGDGATWTLCGTWARWPNDLSSSRMAASSGRVHSI